MRNLICHEIIFKKLLRLQQLGLTFGYRSRIDWWSKYSLLQSYEKNQKKYIRSAVYHEEKNNR